MRPFSRHVNALAQRWMRVNGFADVHRVCTHLNGQCNLANHVAGMGADHAATQNFAVTMCLGKSRRVSHFLNIADRWRGKALGRLIFKTLFAALAGIP